MAQEEKPNNNLPEEQEVISWQQSAEMTAAQSELEKQTKDNPPPASESQEIKPQAGLAPSLFGPLKTIDIESIASLPEAKSMLKIMAHLIDQKDKDILKANSEIEKNRSEKEKAQNDFAGLKESHAVLETKFESARSSSTALSLIQGLGWLVAGGAFTFLNNPTVFWILFVTGLIAVGVGLSVQKINMKR